MTSFHDVLFCHVVEMEGHLTERSNVKMSTTAKRDNYYDNLIKISSCKSCLFSCWWTTTSAFILPGVAVILYSMLKCVFYIQLQSHHNGIVSDWRSVISLPFGANSQHLWQLRWPVSMSEMAFGSSLISLQIFLSYFCLFESEFVFMFLFGCNVQSPTNLKIFLQNKVSPGLKC